VSAPALAIDTSGSFCSVALITEAGALHHRGSQGTGDHFERISQIVSELLDSVGVRASELSHIRIGVGPGSFTGLRIGMSFAKGLAMAAKVPLIGVCSFFGVARTLAAVEGTGPDGRMIVIADARREEVFLAEYLVSASVVQEVFAPRIAPTSEVIEWMKVHPTGIVATPNAGLQLINQVQLQVESDIATGLLLTDVGPLPPFSVIELAQLEPNYIRAVAAKSIEERNLGA
jgi:tRNA threonylcarbamoyl adenosine modification protein YeaZ